MREGNAGVELAEVVDVCGRFDRSLELRSLAFDEVEGQSHGREGQQKIGKQDGRVDLDSPHGLQSDFGG